MLSLKFKKIFSRSLGSITDPILAQMSDCDREEIQTEWLHRALADPKIFSLFSALIVKDNEMVIETEMKQPINSFTDENFVIELLVMGMTIAWLQPQVDSVVNVAPMIGGKEEKKLLDNHKNSIERLESLKLQLHKMIRDRGYIKNSYISGE